MFVTDDRVEIGFGPAALFHCMDELIEAAHAIQLVPVASLGGIESRAQHGNRSVVSLERHWKWMAVLAAVRERETRRVRKSDRRPVDHFGNQRQRLQRARTQLFQKQERREIAQIAFVGNRQHRSQPFQIHVFGSNLVPRGHRKAQVSNCDLGCLMADFE